jgi:hypothetical protein
MTNRSIPDEDAELLSLPDGRLAQQVLALVRDSDRAPRDDDGVRNFFLAKLASTQGDRQLGSDYELELLFFACLLLDIGLTESSGQSRRVEIVGGDCAADWLERRDRSWGTGQSCVDGDGVWQAIALDTSPELAEHRRLLRALMLSMVAIDVIGDD